jgi:hypothetical protein
LKTHLSLHYLQRDYPEAHYALLPSAKNQDLLKLFEEDVHIEEVDGKKMQM